MPVYATLQSALNRLFARRRSSGNSGNSSPPNLPPRPPDYAAGQRWLRLGVNAALADQRDKARYCFTQAVRADESNARAWLYLAGVAGDPANALTAVQRTLALAPADPQARLGYVWARYELGLLPIAHERITNPLPGRRTPPLGFHPIPEPTERPTQPQPPAPASARAWVQLGINAALKGNRSYARYCFTKAAEMPLNERRLDEVLLRRRAWLYLAGVADDPAIALAALERVLAEEPENTEALRGIRWAAKCLNLSGYQWRSGWVM